MHAIDSLGSLVEAVAPMLGFAPQESVVVVAVRNGSAECAMRLDLSQARQDGMVDHLAQLAMRQGAEAAAVVIISDEGALCPVCGEAFAELARDLAVALDRHGGRLLDAVVVDRMARGGRWHCVDRCGHEGVLDDPSVSAAAAAMVVAGRRMYPDREALTSVVARDGTRAAAVAPLLGSGSREVECVAVAVRSVLGVMRRLAGGEALADADLAGVGAVLIDMRVRDTLFTVADDPDEAAAAEGLWVLLARVLPQPFRAEALVLVAVSAYLRGDGTLAGIAVDAALDEEPTHRLSALLDKALQNGVTPAEIRSVLAGIAPAVTL